MNRAVRSAAVFFGLTIGASNMAMARAPATIAPAAAQTAPVRSAIAGPRARAHLRTFDTLDFEVFSNQRWDRLAESHAKDIAVHWPDGHVTHGIERHIADLQAMFAYAPDTRIKEHPVRIGAGEWTSVIGVMEGTFTKPMAGPDGSIVQPTGKAFRLPMVTVGHWKDGVMNEEYLFWDGATFAAQLGLTK